MEQEKVMTIKEVATSLDVSEDSVLRAAKEFYPESVRNGKTTLLNEVQATAIKLKIATHHNLRTTAELPKTDLEKELLIAQAMQFQNEKIERLSASVAIMAPKAEFYDAVVGSPDTIEIGEAAKMLAIPGVGRNVLFGILRDKSVLMENNQPYQRFIDAGYFRTVESKYTTPDGTVHVNIKTVVYQRGLDYIRKIVEGRKE